MFLQRLNIQLKFLLNICCIDFTYYIIKNNCHHTSHKRFALESLTIHAIVALEFVVCRKTVELLKLIISALLS